VIDLRVVTTYTPPTMNTNPPKPERAPIPFDDALRGIL